ncbi:MAG: DUF2695 domain-containing protein [Pseudonocardiaceae bacterium]|nr:DUF2695 domain-containing protein [Pseudonocardiaceae bacterium]
MRYDDASRSLARLRGLDRWGDEYDDVHWEDDDDPPAPPLQLSPTQQAALASAITEGVQERGCDNTLRAAEAWVTSAGLDWGAVQAGLQGRGGYCDCEVLFNVGLTTP